MHTTEIDGIFVNPRSPQPGAIAKMGDDTHLEVTVIADNPLSSCNYKMARQADGRESIASERARLKDHASKVGYSGIAQIVNYVTGECVTFRL